MPRQKIPMPQPPVKPKQHFGLVQTPNGKEVECFIPLMLVKRYCVTLGYGGMTCLIAQPTSDTSKAYRIFNEHVPNVGRKGPRPILRLWTLTEEKQFIPKKGGD